jgi:hypothetical protein
LGQAEALSGVAQGTYAANMNQISQQGMAAQQNIQAQMGVGQALSGALGGVGAAYSQLGAARGGVTQYGSMAAASQAAPYASGISQVQGMGYVPRASRV